MDLQVIPFAFPGLERIRCAFQTRLKAGCRPGEQQSPYDWGTVVHTPELTRDEVLANREQLQEQLGFTWWQECRQVHGDDMVFDPEPARFDQGASQEADGLATSRTGQALVIKTADCQPLLVAHESQKFVAALHVGWRGNRMGFVQSGVGRFCERYGVAPASCYAVRGPSLGPGASEFVNYAMEWGREFETYYDAESQTVDLWRLTREQLLDAGLKPARIFGLDLCTYTLQGHFFSYRREKQSGRQASCIWIEGD